MKKERQNEHVKELSSEIVKVYAMKTTRKTDLGIERDYYDILVVLDGKDFVLGYKPFYSKKQKGLFAMTIKKVMDNA